MYLLFTFITKIRLVFFFELLECVEGENLYAIIFTDWWHRWNQSFCKRRVCCDINSFCHKLRFLVARILHINLMYSSYIKTCFNTFINGVSIFYDCKTCRNEGDVWCSYGICNRHSWNKIKGGGRMTGENICLKSFWRRDIYGSKTSLFFF